MSIHVYSVIQKIFIEHVPPVQLHTQLLIETDFAFGLNKGGYIGRAHLLRTGAVAQIKTFVAAMGAVGTFWDMDDDDVALPVPSRGESSP